MASTIQLKTGTGSAVPDSLTQGEVAINIDKGFFYYGSGSTNTVKQLEKFTDIKASGNITGSNISASGDIIGNNMYVASAMFHDNDANTGVAMASDTITVKSNNITIGTFKTTGGTLLGHPSYPVGMSGSIVHISGSTGVHIRNKESKIELGTTGNVNITGVVTASGHISSSGNIFGRQFEQIMTNTVYDFDDGGFVYLPWGDTDNENTSLTNKYINRAVVVPGRPVKTIMRSPQNHLGADGTAYTMSLWRAPAETNATILVSACHANADGDNREAITFDWRNPNSGSANTFVETGDRILMSLSSSNSQNNANYTITHLFEWDYGQM